VDVNERLKKGNFISLVTIVINIILTIFKAVLGIIGNSTAVIADAMESAADIFSTFGIMLGFRISVKPADLDHPYGHEKAESVFAKLLSIILVLSGILIGWTGLKKILTGNITPPETIALAAPVVTILVKEWMFWYTMYYAKKLDSTALSANAWHHRSDGFSSIATLIGVFGARFGFPVLDPIAGIFVSFFIIKIGVELYIKSVKELMDTSADAETVNSISEFIKSQEGVLELLDLKTRKHGYLIYADAEICVDKNLSVYLGHEIAEKVRAGLLRFFKNIKDINIHVNPCTFYNGKNRDDLPCESCKNKG